MKTFLLPALIFMLAGACSTSEKWNRTGSEIYLDSHTRIPANTGDSALLAMFLDFSIRTGGPEYYEAEMFYPPGRNFKVINLSGEYTGATYNPFVENFVIRDNRLIPTGIPGKIFRIDKLHKKRYLFYTNDISRMGNRFAFYEVLFENDTLLAIPTEQHGNYLFDLIQSREQKAGNLAKKLDFSRKFNVEELFAIGVDTTLMEPNEYYFLTDEQFLLTEVAGTSFFLYYKHSRGDVFEKILRITTETETKERILAMTSSDGGPYSLSSEFVDDSTYKETILNRETIRDEQTLMVYRIDSVMVTYRYTEAFDFKEIKRDSFSRWERYKTGGK